MARRRRGARAPVEWARLLEGGPRQEHRPHRLGRVPAHASRRGGDRLRHLALPRGAAEGAGDDRGERDVRRGLRRRVGGGVCAPRREGPLREGVQGRDQGVHRRLRPVRGARVAGDPDRVRARGAGRERAADPAAARATRPDPGGGPGMSVATETKLIAPHGGELVDRTGERPDDLRSLETLPLTSRERSDLDMLASGALSPLGGFMGRDDYDSVLENMRLSNGLPWALPVCLAVEEAPTVDRVALDDCAGLEREEGYRYDKEREAQQAFGTTDDAHPGVGRLYAQKPLYLAGRVTVFERAESPFPELALDPADTRAEFARRGWKRVVGFQTRNPIHRAHEYLTKVALETVDGLLVHPLVGDTKSDDVPAKTRVECYGVLLDGYYPADRVVLSAFPAAMRYAGPREAIWHAICRKNY